MNYTNILIKEKSNFSSMKKVAHDALINETHIENTNKYPLIYKYLGTSTKDTSENPITTDDTIGTIENLRMSNIGDIICDVHIMDEHPHSNQFNGRIDNIIVGIEGTSQQPIFIAGVIYDKFAKHVLDKKRSKSNTPNVSKLDQTPITDKVALDKSINPLRSPEVQQSIADEMKEVFKNE